MLFDRLLRGVRKCTAQPKRFWLIFTLRLVILSIFTLPFSKLKKDVLVY